MFLIVGFVYNIKQLQLFTLVTHKGSSTKQISSLPGYFNMEAFNIKIQVGNSPLTLTILPVDATLFKVIYFGAVLGAVRKQDDTDCWQAVPVEELTAGDLPFYQHDPNADHEKLELTSPTIHQIGQEIEKEQISSPENEKA